MLVSIWAREKLSGPAGACVSATWKLAPGEALRVQLVRVLEPHESLGSPLLVLLVWKERPVYGYVGNEPCRNDERAV